MKYRPEIDGLRAIAVLLVFVFHLFPALCTGGFIGVDVFFVISGFLITKIIHDKLVIGNFSFLDFYQRRVLRIFPALFALLIFCVIAAFFVLGSRDFLALMKTTRYAAAQISNIYFAKEVNYFAEGNDLSPLLHTWSLGVEEQFYLFWPLILFGFSKLGAARVQKISLVALCVLSFGLSVYMVNELPKMAFYFMPSRLWELGLGGLLGMGFFPLTENKKIAELMSLCGLGLVFSSAFMLDGESLFPGVNAIYSVVGSALLIYATPVADISRKLLSLKPLVFVGKISYSLYLWHWPLIVFVKNYTQQEIPIGIGLGIFVISFPMAYFSWKFVENPFRHLTKKENGYQCKVIGAGVLTIVMMIVGANGVKGFHDSDFRFLSKPLVADNNIHGAHDKCGYSEYHLKEGVDLYKTENCSHNTSNGKRRAVIFGDSHASHLFPAFEKIAKDQDLNVGLLVSSSCPSFWGGFNMYQRNKHIQRCGIFLIMQKRQS